MIFIDLKSVEAMPAGRLKNTGSFGDNDCINFFVFIIFEL